MPPGQTRQEPAALWPTCKSSCAACCFRFRSSSLRPSRIPRSPMTTATPGDATPRRWKASRARLPRSVDSSRPRRSPVLRGQLRYRFSELSGCARTSAGRTRGRSLAQRRCAYGDRGLPLAGRPQERLRGRRAIAPPVASAAAPRGNGQVRAWDIVVGWTATFDHLYLGVAAYWADEEGCSGFPGLGSQYVAWTFHAKAP